MAALNYNRNRGCGIINTNFGSLVSQSLASKVLGEDYATKRVVKKSKYHRGTQKFPMECVLEARRLYEQVGLPLVEVQRRINGHGYNVTITTIRNWCFYTSFRHDEPAENAAPYLPIRTSASE